MIQLAMGLASLLVLVMLAACASCWTVVLLKVVAASRWAPRSLAEAAAQLLIALGYLPAAPLLPWSARRPVPWGLVDLVGVLAVLVFALPVVLLVLQKQHIVPVVSDEARLPLADKEVIVWFDSLAKLGLLVAVGPLIAMRTRATWRDFGFSLRDLWFDFKLGLTGFVMLAPPVYAMQGVLVYFWKPSKHPLMEMFKESPTAGFFAVLVLAAAIVAPLFEELVFRVLLQGFLEKAFSLVHPIYELLFGTSDRIVAPVMPIAVAVDDVSASPPSSIARANDCPVEINPYAPPAVQVEAAVAVAIAGDEDQAELRGRSAWLPIAMSSLVFALLHYSHGPDWVPLLFLAAGMGYLYQRTHRVVPSLIVHALLNSLSMFGLWLQVFAMPEQGG